MVETLVSLKANLEAADKIKFTPLMAAAASGTAAPMWIIVLAARGARGDRGGGECWAAR